MRILVYGVGAVGGTLAAALTLAGHEVVGVSRGAQLDAIQQNGLRLRTSLHNQVAHFECVGSPCEIDLQSDDVVLLCVKSHDSAAAFEQLRAAGLNDQPVFCTQNGVANEREALRYFPNVHGVVVMMPSMYVQAGEVAVFGEPSYGILDIGRAPLGVDKADASLAEALNSANFSTYTCHNVMELKRSKLLLNLENVVQAALGLGADTGDLVPRLRKEAESVYEARGLSWQSVKKPDPRLKGRMHVARVPGVTRVGGSTLQSLLRNAGSIETDFLNGEIVLQGRLAGIETPLNYAMTCLGERLLREKAAPGSMSLKDIQRMLT